ncbi:hypothetical protein [Burkholderia sp. EMB26]|uniref:hypothetical protein n=1 Tax=Burkholderia sp. EMB26 TaxID=2854261 RepID=UPI00215A2505|nr:hypothetical protein [Burkholderia sp. EMB26]UVE55299.1 hypothetical protein KU887_06410 [Burkholderia sp. EMB26]
MARLAMAVVLAVVVQQPVAVKVAAAQVPRLPAVGPHSLPVPPLVPAVKAALPLVGLPLAVPATSTGCPRSTA